MDEQIEFLKVVVSRLESADIPFMLTGSMAMSVYAVPRMTRDIDLVVACVLEDAEKIARLFDADCYVDVESIRDAIRRRSMFNIIHSQSIIKADFIVRKDTPYRREEFRRRRLFEIEGTALYVVAPEDLILSKLAWAKDSGSELHLRDVRTIVASKLTLEWPYMERWAGELGVEGQLKEVRGG